MRYVILILFFAFIAQADTVRVDSTVAIRTAKIQKRMDHDLNQLDSIIAALKKDTLNKKK